MNLLHLARALLIAPLLWAPSIARACSCLAPYDPRIPLLSDGKPVPSQEELVRQQFLFVGTALARTALPTGSPESDRMFLRGSATVFRVEQSWQNEVFFDRLTVFSAFPGGGCGFLFEPGRCYIVFASVGPDGLLSTNVCTRTAPWEHSTDLLIHIRASLGPPNEEFQPVLGVPE